ncbi:Ger(x)C family spore germination protein [Paenibacillus thermotolerans]|uniref:Ger(x)C family spore germination protein n=1 Tax=Paenibacillus thermotolerans TaxID=3027807 RepID=UPI0023685C11|nr:MULTISPECIES: Ger(x)C family spore germination protein [unclassified Paenibacillus]
MPVGKKIVQVSGLVVILLAMPFLSGCWDRLELEERALVLGVGIDEAEKKPEEMSNISSIGDHPNTETGNLKVTVQIAVPGRIPLGPGQGGGGGGGGGGGKQTVWVVSATGHTIEDAFNSMQQKTAPPLFFGHLRIIVVSESVAKKGIGNINDYFRRNPEVRRMNWMFISKGKAEQLIQLSPQLERVPAVYLLTTMDQSVKMGRFPLNFLGMFWSSVSAKGREGYLPYVEYAEGSTIRIDGLAYFVKEKLVGTTGPLDIPLFMGIKGMSPAGGEVYVKVPGTENDYVMFGGTSRKSSIKPSIRNGKPHITVRIFIEGNLLEKSNNQFNINSKTVMQIQRQLQENARKEYLRLIRQTQQDKSDIFGFGEYVRAKEPAYWNKHIKNGDGWLKVYKDLPVDVHVDMNVRRVGMSAK